MAQDSQPILRRSVLRIFRIIKLEGKEISAIYYYAILNGLLQLTIPIGIQSIINFVLAGSFSASMVVLIAAVVLGVFFTGVLQINQMKLNEKIQQNLFTNYAFEFSYRLPRIDMKSVDSYYMPELVNRFFDVVSLQKGLSKLLLDIPAATIQILFGLILLSLYNAVFIFFGILLIVILAIILYSTSNRGLETSMEESDFKYSVAGWLQETARIMRSLKFSHETDIHLHKTDQYVSGYLKARTAHFRILLLQYWSLIFFKVFITAAMLIVGGFLLLDQQLNVGQFVAAEIVIITVLASIEKFIVSLDKVYDVLTSAEKLGKVIDKPMEKSGTLVLNANQGIAVKVENVTFGYNNDEMILQNVSLDAPAGSVVNLLGSEGSGKSTILRLLTGSFTEFSGRILLNGIPIGNYSIHDLRKSTGIYFSQQEIFSGTLWENISMGNCAYGLDDITRIAEKIGLSPFIAQQKNGFNTVLDPVGHRLNKTTTRKILFLRAIADRPKLLLLEEPWEGMDESSRRQMIDVLVTDLKGATIIVATNDAGFSKYATHVFDMGIRKY